MNLPADAELSSQIQCAWKVVTSQLAWPEITYNKEFGVQDNKYGLTKGTPCSFQGICSITYLTSMKKTKQNRYLDTRTNRIA